MMNNLSKSHKSKILLYRLSLIASLSLLSACSDSMDDLTEYVASVKARPAGTVEPIPELRPYRSFAYPGHTKDPFDGSILEPKETKPVFEKGISIDRSRTPEYLEGFPLDSLSMVGTVMRNKVNWALIKTPDGMVHRVKLNNYLGQNHGKVVAIDDGQVVLKEIVQNGMGGYKERENKIALSEVESKK